MLLTFLTSLTIPLRPSKAVTIFGWTPGLRALVGGRVMACGCLSGTYATWTDDVVVIIDARGECCPHGWHAVNTVLVGVTHTPPGPRA